MEEDLKHIDLIDKYLSGSLKGSEAITFQDLLKNDDNFKKEVEVYKRIYDKIEARGETNFKKRLDIYHKEYLAEKSGKPKGIYKKLIIFSSIAAAVIFGIFIFNNYETGQKPIFNQSDPVIVDSEKDSLKINKDKDEFLEQEKVIVHEDNSTIDSIYIPNNSEHETQLSIGGLKKLPTNDIRSANYPIDLQYTFIQNEIVLFGDPSISGLQLQILKNKSDNYFLKYQDQYYTIPKSKVRKALKVVSDFEVKTAVTKEQITVKLKGIDAITSVLKDIEVSYTGNKVARPTYMFEETESGLHLIINGDVSINKTKLYKIGQNNMSSYFLKIDNTLYPLNLKVTEPTPLKETNILTNDLTQLFREDTELPIEMVYLIK